MALDDLLATLERQGGTSGTSGVLADVPAKPAPALGGTSGTSGTAENGKGKAQAEAFTAWLMHFTDRESFEVRFSPPATLAEVLAAYPAAVAAEPARQHESDIEERSTPTPAPRNAPAASCRTCRHLKRPGLSNGHCSGRDDLPHAYTAEHPLRRLPNDHGASCTSYNAEE